MASSSSLAAPPAARQAPSSRVAHRPADDTSIPISNGHASSGYATASSPSYANGGISQRQPAASPPEKQAASAPPTAQAPNPAKSKSSLDRMNDSVKVSQDIRKGFPTWLRRWTGWRPEGEKPPHKPLPIPPFTWLAKLPLKYETWILSCIGSFGGIALIEVIIAAAFPNDGTILVGEH